MKDRTVSMLEYLHDAIDVVVEEKEGTKGQKAVGIAVVTLLDNGEACTWWSVDDARTFGLVGALEVLKHGILESVGREDNDDDEQQEE